MVPTPFVAAGVVELGAAAGVMVTASHNPKEYNGYKVYWGNGCQIIPPHDVGIAAAITANLDLWSLPSEAELLASLSLSDPWDIVTSRYYQRLGELRYLPPEGAERSRALNALGRPVYTPLHGVGAEALLEAFRIMDLPMPYVVPEQRDPDPEFPTVVFPNPEEGKGTWSMAFQAGVQQGARLVLANDPDADRLCVAERCAELPGGWRVFSGNEIGTLLAHWVWTNFRKRHPEVPPSRCVMLASTVSSQLLGAMAAVEGFRFVSTLTGFKWLGSKALQLEQEEGAVVLFAFEEAIGFMLGAMYRDKDGISAAATFTELAAHTYGSGHTLDELLKELYGKYGYFDYRSGYFIADKPEKSFRAIFLELRGGGEGGSGATARYASTIGGVPVLHVRDLGKICDRERVVKAAGRASILASGRGRVGAATGTLFALFTSAAFGCRPNPSSPPSISPATVRSRRIPKLWPPMALLPYARIYPTARPSPLACHPCRLAVAQARVWTRVRLMGGRCCPGSREI
ncbi:hypothetical protein Vafri_5656 [Volvox africanus]|nr:hypothetical protein Vafri_5656 [Volvox africanus]